VNYVKTEVALGITICFAQIPESVAFAFMAHIKPPVALHAAWVVGLICTVFGGRRGMVNGAEGAFASIISSFIPEPDEDGGNGEGIELLFPSVMACGGFMLLIWLTGSYKYISMLPASVMLGFCNGLAIVIGESQLHPFYEGHGDEKKLRQGAEFGFMFLEMMVAMLVMEFVPKIPCKFAKLLPSSLLSIVVAMFIEFCIVRPIGEKTQVIGDVQEFTFSTPMPFFLNDDYDMNLISTDDIGTILGQGALLAVAGMIQGLLTTEVVYDFLKTPTHTPAVALSCGIANVVSGFLGGMGGDAMIGLSTINCLNGGTGRLAPTVTALGIMSCMFGFYGLLNFIPVAALAGVMIVVVLHTFKWFSLRMIIAAIIPDPILERIHRPVIFGKNRDLLPKKVDRYDALIVVVVTVMVVLRNLVEAVGAGLLLAVLRYAWESSKDITIDKVTSGKDRVVYHVAGKLYFGTSMRFHTLFDYEEDPDSVDIVLLSAPADYSATQALAKVSALYAQAGKELSISFIEPSFIRSPGLEKGIPA